MFCGYTALNMRLNGSKTSGLETETPETPLLRLRSRCAGLLQLSLLLFLATSAQAQSQVQPHSQPRYAVLPEQWDDGEGAVDLCRLSADFDGNGSRDYALGAFCGVHAECSFEVFLAGTGAFTSAGSMFVGYDSVQVCPQPSGSPQILAWIYENSAEVTRREYHVLRGNLREVQVWWSLGDEATWPTDLPLDCGHLVVLERTTDSAWLSRGDAAWIDSSLNPCTEATNQLVLNTCAAEEQDAADAKMKTVYRALLQHSRPGQKARLSTAQRHWFAFREAACGFEAAAFFEGGQAEPMVRDGCLKSLTQTRTAQLREQLEALLGDQAGGAVFL